MKHIHFALLAIILMTSCTIQNGSIEPQVSHTVVPKELKHKTSPFEEPDSSSISNEWNKERKIGSAFAQDLDLYRAITAYKRALVLLPVHDQQARLELQYHIVHCYYLGGKYQEVVNMFESSALSAASSEFPPFNDLLIILHDSYTKLGNEKKSQKVMSILEQSNPGKAGDLRLSNALLHGRISEVSSLASADPQRSYIADSMNAYKKKAKSMRRAQVYNALLPGSGYWYAGQKKSAITSFFLNSVFIAAAYNFFDNDHIAAGIFTTSLELGWYIGGINGAGLAVKEYNERLYETQAKSIAKQELLFPVYMLEYNF